MGILTGSVMKIRNPDEFSFNMHKLNEVYVDIQLRKQQHRHKKPIPYKKTTKQTKLKQTQTKKKRASF